MKGCVCDRIFDCDGWEKNVREIPVSKGEIFLPVAAGCWGQYRGTPFNFCPWCGKDIRWRSSPSGALGTNPAQKRTLREFLSGVNKCRHFGK